MIWPTRIMQLPDNDAIWVRGSRCDMESALNQVLTKRFIFTLNFDTHITVNDEAGSFLFWLRRAVCIYHVDVA